MKGVCRFKKLYYNLKNGISNLIRWFPVIWRDRDYDWSYLMIMLEHKLDNMSRLHENHGYGFDSQDVARELKEASKMAGRIAREEPACSDKRESVDLDKLIFTPVEDGIFSISRFTELPKEEKDKILKMVHLEGESLEQEIEAFFDIMKRDLRDWWN